MTKPLIVGIGGTIRAGSSTERCLGSALRHAESLGAETIMLGGEFLARLPIFDPRPSDVSDAQQELADTVCRAHGVIVASPGYHGSISGVIKNALPLIGVSPFWQMGISGLVIITAVILNARRAQAIPRMAGPVRAHRAREWADGRPA